MSASASQNINTNFKIEANGKVWLSFPALVTAGVPENTAKDGLMAWRKAESKLWEQQEDESDRRRVWIAFDSLPLLQKDRVKRHFGDIIEIAAIDTIKQAVKQVFEAKDTEYFLKQRIRKDGATYTNAQAVALSDACAWLRWLDNAANSKIWKSKIPIKTGVFIDKTVDFYAYIAEILKAEAIYGFNIKNGNYLYQKLTKWRELGRNCLLSGHFGNDNPSKIKAADLDFAVTHYAQNKKSVPQIIDLLAQNRDTKVTRQALKRRLDDPSVKQIWFPVREGLLQAQQESWSYVKNAKAPFADALWLVDGTQIALFYNDNGQVRKSTMNAVFIRDHFSNKCIGLAFGQTETSDLVKLALRRAVLNANKLPFGIRYDGGSANTSAAMKTVFDKIGNHHWKTMAYHQGGKAPVEKLVNEVENVLRSGFDNFAGGNITRVGTEKDYNPDTVKRMLKSGLMPNTEGVLFQYWAAVEVVNNQKKSGKKSFAQTYAECNDPRRREASIEIVAAAFWEKRPHASRYERGGLKIEINGQRCEYWVGQPMLESVEFKRRYEGASFYYRLDTENPQRIALYTADDAFVAEACLKHEYSLLAEFSETGEQQNIRQHILNQKAFITEGVEKYKEAVQRVEERGEPTKFDFLELHKDALQNSEAFEKEGMLEMLTNTTKKRDKNAKKELPVAVELPQKTETNDDFDIFKFYS